MQPIRHPHWDYYCKVVLFELSYFVLDSELQNGWINATPVRGMSGKWVTLGWSVGLVVSFQLDLVSHEPLKTSNCCYNHGIKTHLSSTFKQNWVESAKPTATTFTSRSEQIRSAAFCAFLNPTWDPAYLWSPTRKHAAGWKRPRYLQFILLLVTKVLHLAEHEWLLAAPHNLVTWTKNAGWFSYQDFKVFQITND